MAQIIPLTPAHVGSRRLRSVRPMTGASIVRLNRDTGAAFVPATRPLNEGEIAYLRDYMAPVRNEVELRRLKERRERVQRIVLVAALAVAWFCLVYFCWQLGRGAL